MSSIQELKILTRKELLHELLKAERELQQGRIHVNTKHQKDTSLIRKKRRMISQINTILREMDIEKALEEANKID